jgi:hypothetical protein
MSRSVCRRDLGCLSEFRCVRYRLDDVRLPGSFSSCARNPISTFMATRSSASAALILTGSYSFFSMRSHTSRQRGNWCPVETMRPRISRLLCAHFVLSSVSHDTSVWILRRPSRRAACAATRLPLRVWRTLSLVALAATHAARQRGQLAQSRRSGYHQSRSYEHRDCPVRITQGPQH